VLAGVRKKRHEPGALEGDGKPALVLGACTRLPAGLDLPAIGKEPAQPVDVLVVDRFCLLDAKDTYLAAGAEVAPATPVAAAIAAPVTVTAPITSSVTRAV